MTTASDWIIPQDWAHYSAQDHTTWDTLFARQSAMLPGRASAAFLRGIDVLKLSKPGIPDFAELSERLTAATGWRVVAVPGLIPDDVFFDCLARRRRANPSLRSIVPTARRNREYRALTV